MRKSAAILCRIKSHQSVNDLAKHEGCTRPLRSATLTMCAVNAARLSNSPESCEGLPFETNRSNIACVPRNPRQRRLTATIGRRTIARRNKLCAGRSSALNRRSRSHISGEYLQQPVVHEPVQQFQKIRS